MIFFSPASGVEEGSADASSEADGLTDGACVVSEGAGVSEGAAVSVAAGVSVSTGAGASVSAGAGVSVCAGAAVSVASGAAVSVASGAAVSVAGAVVSAVVSDGALASGAVVCARSGSQETRDGHAGIKSDKGSEESDNGCLARRCWFTDAVEELGQDRAAPHQAHKAPHGKEAPSNPLGDVIGEPQVCP